VDNIRMVVMLFLLSAGLQVAFSQEEDTLDIAEKDTIAVASPAVASAKDTFQVIDQVHHEAIKKWVLQQEPSLKSVLILALGFESNTDNSLGKNLAVILLDSDNQPQKQIFPIDNDFYQTYSGTKKEVAPVSETVAETVTEPPEESAVALDSQAGHPEDGRLYFMINTTLRSMLIYPSGITEAMQGTDGQVITGLSLLSIGGALYGSYAFSKSIELGYGRVEFMNYGGDMGGGVYPWLFQLAIDPTFDMDGTSIHAISSMIGFPIGIYIGSRMTYADNYAYGNASMMTNLSRAASLYGFGLMGVVTNFEGDSPETFVSIGSALSMGFIPLGFYIGNKIVGDRDVSSGRSIMTLTAGIGGAVSAALIPTWFEYEEGVNLFFACAMLGHIGGTALGFNYHKDLEHTFAQGTFTAVSSVIGIGIGLSLPLLASADTHQAYTVAGILGCWGGFFLGEHLSLSLFEKDRHDNRTSDVSLSFPGLASVPFLFISQQFAGGGDHTAASFEMRPEFQSRVTLMEMRF
jgi:hypothetical protein